MGWRAGLCSAFSDTKVLVPLDWEVLGSSGAGCVVLSDPGGQFGGSVPLLQPGWLEGHSGADPLSYLVTPGSHLLSGLERWPSMPLESGQVTPRTWLSVPERRLSQK